MKNHFNEVFELMEKSFPKEEYRIYEHQKKLLGNPKYSIKTEINEHGKLIAFISFWKLDGFDFIEHFAVDTNQRGQGIGSKMLKNFLENSKKPIILEVEIPKDDISKRRIGFYEKNGFLLNTYDYYQLPLRKETSEVKLYIMSHPKKLGFEDFKKVKDEIHKNVYA